LAQIEAETEDPDEKEAREMREKIAAIRKAKEDAKKSTPEQPQ
jgi:hypothetical protein